MVSQRRPWGCLRSLLEKGCLWTGWVPGLPSPVSQRTRCLCRFLRGPCCICFRAIFIRGSLINFYKFHTLHKQNWEKE
jgi:hypothetical protein